MESFVDLASIAERYNTEEKARAFFEATRWPEGAICPHCGCRNAFKLGQRSWSKKHARPGLWMCRECKDQFTVTEGTVMESSKIPLHKWLLAMYLMGASKKGVSAHQIHRTLGITYKSAWFLAHRIRYAMTQEPIKSRLSGVVEMDQTYMGGKMRNSKGGRKQPPKFPVVSLVQRDGGSRSFHVASVNAENLRQVLRENVKDDATLYTDSFGSHKNLDTLDHHMVNHEQGEYVRGPVHTNTVEGFFSILKRGIYGVYHNVSPQHLQRYLNEFDFRYSLRKASDSNRALIAIQATQGKRLKYRELPSYDEDAKTKGKRFWHKEYRAQEDRGPQQPEPPFGPSARGDYS